MRTTTIRLPEPLHEELRRFCSDRGAVMSRVVTIAVREYLGDEAASPRLPPPAEEEEDVVRAMIAELDAREVSP